MTLTAPIAPNAPTSLRSPNDVLATEVTDVLVAAGLIKEAHKASLLEKLKDGGVSQEDWNLWIDMATAPRVTQGASQL